MLNMLIEYHQADGSRQYMHFQPVEIRPQNFGVNESGNICGKDFLLMINRQTVGTYPTWEEAEEAMDSVFNAIINKDCILKL